MLRIITFILAIYCCISTASGATFSVSNLNDSGAGSFRQAVIDANADPGATTASPHMINFTLSGQINLLSVLPDINNHMTINGDISGNTINRSSGGPYRILNVIGAKKVTLNNLIIQNGSEVFGNRGGGMRISEDGTHVTCNNCVFQNNYTDSAGGGIAIEGSTAVTLVLNNCTVIGNTSIQDGGGIHNRGGTLTAVNCTIANNTHHQSHGAGGLDALFLSVTTLINCTITGNHSIRETAASGASFDNILHMTNTIIAGNTGGVSEFLVNNCCASFIGGTNLNNLVTTCSVRGDNTCPTFAFTSDPNLGALTTCGLQSYFPLNPGSIAINAGTTTGAPTTDICENARTGNPDLGSAEAPSCPDGDGDGFTAASCGGTDCNDNNTAINPGAAEACDGIDNNCNGSTDEGVQTTYYRDQDGDGFGNPAITQSGCSQPVGYVANNTDCNDNSNLEKPAQVWYKDTDNDGYGQTGAATITQCLRPTGYKVAAELTSTTGDCNDANAAINPAATETCDGVDNNCSGSADEGVQTTYYRDQDSDGFGNGAITQSGCSQPVGYVANNTDCDDSDPLEKPGQTWYADADNDGYSTGIFLVQCLRPAGFKVATELTAIIGDCNDSNNAINPAATEICDGMDNNCSGSTDEGVKTTYYRDQDGDGFGNPAITQSGCSQPAGYVANNTDCNDNSNLEKPAQDWYKDTDNDGYGQTGAATITQCVRPAGYKVAAELTSTTGDCNDTNAAINPAATEICDHIDNDCSGLIDDISGNTVGNWVGGSVGGAGGSASFPPCYAAPNDLFTLQANGFSTSSSDKLRMVYQQLCGNGEIIARVLNVQNGGWGGIMMRENLDPGAKKVSLKTQLALVIRREIRNTTNGAVSMVNFNRPQHRWLRLVRNGSNFTGYTSTDGANWSYVFGTTISMNGCIYAGVFAESINTNVMTTASFDHVQITGGSQPLIQGSQTPVAASDAGVEVYPNPTNGEVNLNLVNVPAGLLTIQVFNTLGESVLLKETDGASLVNERLDLSDLADGVYFITVQATKYAPVTKRIVLAK